MNFFKKIVLIFIIQIFITTSLCYGLGISSQISVLKNKNQAEWYKQKLLDKYEMIGNQQPATFHDLNENLKKAKSRGFFDQQGKETIFYTQAVLIYPQQENIFKGLLSRIKKAKIKGLHVPDPSSCHVSVHIVYYDKSSPYKKNLLDDSILGNKFKQAIKKHFSKEKPAEVLFEKMSLTSDGTLVLWGIFKDEEDNANIQKLRQEFCNIQNKDIRTNQHGNRRKTPMDVVHVSLGRILPGKDKFKIDQDSFEKLKLIIEEYNKSGSYKERLVFDNIALIRTRNPFAQSYEYIQQVSITESRSSFFERNIIYLKRKINKKRKELKTFIFDIDGTITNEEKEIPEEIIEEFVTLLKKGKNIVICSGRPYLYPTVEPNYLNMPFKKFGFDIHNIMKKRLIEDKKLLRNFYMAPENGAYIIDGNGKVIKEFISGEKIRKNLPEKFKILRKKLGEMYKGKYSFIIKDYAIAVEVGQSKNKIRSEIGKLIREILEDEFIIIETTGSFDIGLTPEDGGVIDKGRIVKYFQENGDKVFAVGDSCAKTGNDYNMVKNADFGVSVFKTDKTEKEIFNTLSNIGLSGKDAVCFILKQINLEIDEEVKKVEQSA